MANIVDYLVWRGEFSFDITPWCPVDGLLFAVLSYLNFHGINDARGWTLEEAARIDLLQSESDSSGSFESRRKAFLGMAGSKRFRESRMHHFISLADEEKHMQFSALCVDLPDGSMCVAFRGTDNTLLGWREDFDMSFQTIVPAQEASIYYLTQAAACTDRPLRIVGHSKGGNLAVYAASLASEAIQDRILEIDSFDGPGMNREMAQHPGYLRIRPKIRSFIPQTSIIGLLMEYFRPYTVVRSLASGINQHDPMTWQVYGSRFEELPAIDEKASVVRDTLHDWLDNSTPDQRSAFVDTLFQLIDTTKATRFSDLTAEKWKNLITMAGNRREVPPEARRIFNRLMAQAVSLGFGNMVDLGKSKFKKPDSGEAPPPAVPDSDSQ